MSPRKRTSFATTALILLFLALGALAFLLFRDRQAPFLTLTPDAGKVSASTLFKLSIEDQASKIKTFKVTVTQGQNVATLLEKTYAKAEAAPTEAFSLKNASLKNGDILLTVTATDGSFANFGQGNTSTLKLPFSLDTVPPRIFLNTGAVNIRQGGAGAVSFKTNEPLSSAGIRIENYYYPAFQQADGSYVCLFPFPYFMTPEEYRPELFARDEAGNERAQKVYATPRKRKFKKDTLNLPDSFLERKYVEFQDQYPETPSPLERYLKVNRDLRKENRAMLSSLGRETSTSPLWTGKFLRLPRAASRAGFADHRTYKYKGAKVDEQFHLGLDLASVKHAKVPVANTGKVIFADYLGIYGNVIVVDHGLGLHSLYSHLSEMAVSEGDMVKKGDTIAKTGATGLAGGDHLHFGILISGMPVTPIEWFDSHWLQDNIVDRLPETK